MFVATLLTAPAQPSVDPVLANSLRSAWGGGDLNWLAPGEAVEFSIPAMPDNLWQVLG